jgi:hypothetical protein
MPVLTYGQYCIFKEEELLASMAPASRVGIKKPTQKTHLKKPTKNVFFGVFLGCFKFLIFMNIIQTFLFQTDFL